MEMNETAASSAPREVVTARPNMLINVSAFLVFTALWVLFGLALGFSRGTLDDVWTALLALPWLLEGLACLLLLPVVAGLWIWQQDWALFLRLLLIAGLAVANIVVFYPWRSPNEQRA